MFEFEKTGTGSPRSSCTTVSSSEVRDYRTTNFITTANFDRNYSYKFDEDKESEDFAFDFNVKLDVQSRTADELFDGGKIKLLEEPQKINEHSNAVCVETIRRDDRLLQGIDERRGRERVYYSSTSRRQNISKSLSPTRASTMVPELDHNEKCSKKSSSLYSSSNSSSWYGRWKLTDILLFRNSSDGYAINRKYDKLKRIRSQNEDVIKNSSFRSTDTAFVSMSNTKKKVPADEWQHYKVYQAAAEEMRRKTFLPYKKSIISCMDMDHGGC